ncbi:MAG: hypothetical protein ACKON7_11145 [Planctomycetaceae bacterium]
MDLKIHRPHGVCATTGRSFAPGEAFFSALVRGPAGLERIDCCAEAWTGPPAGTLGWWRSTFPAAVSAGPTLAPVDVLLDVFEELEGRPTDTALRYLLALQLVRRRVLRSVESATGGSTSTELALACRKRDREYRVAIPAATEAASPEVAERLTALVWSGGAA